MRIGVAQIETRASDFSPTSERIVAYSEQAASQGVGLLVVPACALTGAVPVPYVERQGYMMDLAETVVDLADRVACPTVVPVATMVGEEVIPEAMLLSGGQALPLRFSAYAQAMAGGAQGDSVLSDTGTGMDAPTFELEGCRFAVAFTLDDLEDLCDYDFDIDGIVYLPIYGYAADDPASALGTALVEGGFVEDARQGGVWIVAAGSLGCYDTQVFTGGSFILTPEGDLAASAPSYEEALISAVVGPEGEAALSEPLEPEVYNQPFFCWEALALGIRGYARAVGKTDVALALDGTLGSMALATLASDALGPTHVHVLLANPLADVPAAKTNGAVRAGADGLTPWRRVLAAAARRDDCRRLAANLRVDMQERDPELVRATVVGYDAAHGDEERMRAARREAGIVATELADLAARTDALVLSPADKTYLALEADGRAAVTAALLPFGDLYRSDVLEMTRTRNTISPVVPHAGVALCDVPLLDHPELAGLSPEQRLRRIDLALASHIEWERTLSDLATTGESAFAEALIARFDACAPGRASAGVVLEASSRTLGEARRPYGTAWRDRVRDPRELEVPSDEEIEAAFRCYAQNAAAADTGTAGAKTPDGLAFDDAGEPTEESQRNELSDLLGYLRDLAEGVGTGSMRTPGESIPDGEGHRGGHRPEGDFNPFGPFGTSPFSEN